MSDTSAETATQTIYAPAWLSVTAPDGGETRWMLARDETVVGRIAPADIILPLPQISRRHASVTRRASAHYLVDLDSRNGTYANGRAVGREPYRLQVNDEIVLGGVVALRFHDPAATAAGSRCGRLSGIWLSEDGGAIWIDGVVLDPPLSPAQLTLLQLLYAVPGQVVTREQVIAALWPGDNPAGVSQEAVDGLIKRLRARLRELQPGRDYLEVVRGFGVRLNQP
jgi:hypothetical protein